MEKRVGESRVCMDIRVRQRAEEKKGKKRDTGEKEGWHGAILSWLPGNTDSNTLTLTLTLTITLTLTQTHTTRTCPRSRRRSAAIGKQVISLNGCGSVQKACAWYLKIGPFSGSFAAGVGVCACVCVCARACVRVCACVCVGACAANLHDVHPASCCKVIPECQSQPCKVLIVIATELINYLRAGDPCVVGGEGRGILVKRSLSQKKLYKSGWRTTTSAIQFRF